MNSFRFKRKPGGNSIVKFSDGNKVSLMPGDTVDIPTQEVCLLAKMMGDPGDSTSTVFELVGEGSIPEIGKALEEKLNPTPKKEPGKGLKLVVDDMPGYYNVENADGERLNEKRMRKSAALAMIAGE